MAATVRLVIGIIARHLIALPEQRDGMTDIGRDHMLLDSFEFGARRAKLGVDGFDIPSTIVRGGQNYPP
ncbi:hypothetical protein [Sphingomonas sp. Leaf343]|uniref:hypothetical protein n=1 Tax=Sphingomonas sp. Leaf343 TaxID=1736345 RepID=UPI0006F448E4|nr:hypothetical protein [Sphingomonas sp. Leaf343]KQR83634.1 hypothetical protein ASG07_08020 [Sphingomonas sp. Leaf343]